MTDKGNKKLTKLDFYIIIALTYVILALISLILFCLKFNITTILSFLGVTVSPSAPAFLAIFLSQYSEQAEAIRKSEHLTDIQIRKEISLARTEHYKCIKGDLRNIESLIKEQNIKSFNGIFEINVPILNEVRSKLNTYNTASLHLNNFCDPNEKHAIDGFLKSDNTDLEFNDKVKQLEDEVAQTLEKLSKKYDYITLDCPATNPKPGASIGRFETVGSILEIWGSGKDGNQILIDWINNIKPCDSVSKNNLKLDRDKIEYRNITLAKTTGLEFGVKILNIIKEVLEKEDLRSKLCKLLTEKSEIEEKRRILLSQVEKLIYEIESKKYSVVLECCPYKEYDGEIF